MSTDTLDVEPSGGTVDASEIARFTALAAEWWDPSGKFKPLHRLNPVRLTYIRDALCAAAGRDPRQPQPLHGLRLLDVGCGGGLLTEPLARMGATVLGIDAGARNLQVATTHAVESGAPLHSLLNYRQIAAETLQDEVRAGELAPFDAVLALEVVEHVADIDLFLAALAGLTRPGGQVFMATLNRTPKSFALAIIGAEYVLRWLPRGTHDWRKFLRPSELAGGLRRNGVTVTNMTGVIYHPLTEKFSLSSHDLDVNYMLRGVREA